MTGKVLYDQSIVKKLQVQIKDQRMALQQFDKLANVPAGTPMQEVFELLERRIVRLEEQLLFEEALREEYPALQDLYEKYQVTKGLVINGE